jgi:hypothetical protein
MKIREYGSKEKFALLMFLQFINNSSKNHALLRNKPIGTTTTHVS